MSLKEKDVNVLNDLMETVIDSIDGYESAADTAENPGVSQAFGNCAARRRQVLEKLRTSVTASGAEPCDDGSLLAKAHRSLMNLSALVENDTEAAVEAVETGEDHLRKKFEEAHRDRELSSEAQRIIDDCLKTIREDERLSDRLAELFS